MMAKGRARRCLAQCWPSVVLRLAHGRSLPPFSFAFLLLTDALAPPTFLSSVGRVLCLDARPLLIPGGHHGPDAGSLRFKPLLGPDRRQHCQASPSRRFHRSTSSLNQHPHRFASPAPAPANPSGGAMALYPSFGGSATVYINVLVTIVTAGQILLAALFLTFALSKTINKRNPTLLNVIVVSFLASTPSMLLCASPLLQARHEHSSRALYRFYTGDIFNAKPSWTLCLTQATLKNGANMM
jgi:hypothetical protein